MITRRQVEKYVRCLGSRHEADLLACTVAAYEAGEKIAKRDFSQELVGKPDDHVGHHATVGEADLLSQETIFKETTRYLGDVAQIGEEADLENPRFKKYAGLIVTEKDYHDRIINGKVVIADSLDGTVQYEKRTGQWSNSVGIWDKMKNVAGAVYGPRCNFRETGSGLLVFGAADTPTFMLTENGLEKARILKKPKTLKDAFVHYGVDSPFLSPVGIRSTGDRTEPETFMRDYTTMTRTGNTHGSCALGLVLVGTGDSHAFFQPEQRVWDWAAGVPLVERAGGTVILYEVGRKLREMEIYARFEIRKVKKMKPYHFSPAHKPIGFVAACSRYVAEEIYGRLESVSRMKTSYETR